MNDRKKAESIASERVQLLAPLLAEGLDAAKAREIKARISAEAGISERTIRRYLAAYRVEGFGGLQSKGKGRQPSETTIAPKVLDQAILLRREVPGRSVTQLIQILEWEGRITSGCISFQDRKYEVGLAFIGQTVDVIFDPADITELTIEYAHHAPWRVRELVIGERAGKRPPLPEHLGEVPADASRLLAAAEEQSLARKEQQAPAVTYRKVSKEDGHV